MIWIYFIFLQFIPQNNAIREIDYNGKHVKTTYGVDNKFLGTYKGAKKGFMKLNPDGSGSYKYDIFGFALQGCTAEPIDMEWGFILDSENNYIKFEREYGYSYPILLKSVSDNSFKGCREKVMLDFIIEKDGKLQVSSSDDWYKENTK
ncbi:MAG: hypothetical protein OEW75_16655 [Cyclobacteriaceae bacterium]|nr:hypothetical protein [Cyclobacteriaceae bacterium]